MYGEECISYTQPSYKLYITVLARTSRESGKTSFIAFNQVSSVFKESLDQKEDKAYEL